MVTSSKASAAQNKRAQPSKRALAKPVKKPGALKGNQFWKLRTSHGRKAIYEHPEDLWNDCVRYFEWVEDNPIKEEKLFFYQGRVITTTLNRMRVMSLEGMYSHLKIARKTWYLYKKREGFMPVCEQVEDIIYCYQLSGAAAGLLEPCIIARKLKLANLHHP